jgi:hypothetical protein
LTARASFDAAEFQGKVAVGFAYSRDRAAFYGHILASGLPGPMAARRDRHLFSGAYLRHGHIGDLKAFCNLRHGLRPDEGMKLLPRDFKVVLWVHVRRSMPQVRHTKIPQEKLLEKIKTWAACKGFAVRGGVALCGE